MLHVHTKVRNETKKNLIFVQPYQKRFRLLNISSKLFWSIFNLFYIINRHSWKSFKRIIRKLKGVKHFFDKTAQKWGFLNDEYYGTLEIIYVRLFGTLEHILSKKKFCFHAWNKATVEVCAGSIAVFPPNVKIQKTCTESFSFFIHHLRFAIADPGFWF